MIGWMSLGHMTVLTGHLCSGGSHDLRLDFSTSSGPAGRPQWFLITHCVFERCIRKCGGRVRDFTVSQVTASGLLCLGLVPCPNTAHPNWFASFFPAEYEKSWNWWFISVGKLKLKMETLFIIYKFGTVYIWAGHFLQLKFRKYHSVILLLFIQYTIIEFINTLN